MSHWPYILLPTTKPNDDRLSPVTNGTRADENSDGFFAALLLLNCAVSTVYCAFKGTIRCHLSLVASGPRADETQYYGNTVCLQMAAANSGVAGFNANRTCPVLACHVERGPKENSKV